MPDNRRASLASRHPDLSRFQMVDPLLWSGLAAIALGTTAACRLQGISIEGGAAQCLIALVVLLAGCITRGISPRLVSFATLLETLAAFVVFPAVFAPLSYAVTRSPFPAIDATLRAADLLVGFDAVRWHDAVASEPTLRWINAIAYESLLPQSLLALLVLPRVGDGMRGFALLRASSLALLVMAAIAYLLPAIGTIPASESWHQDWLALRQLDVPFRADHVQGIVSFPSFHAAMGLILAYSLRGLGVFSWLVAALDVLMIIATPAGGYHYLTDVAAGLVVAAAAVGLVRHADGRRAGPGRLAWRRQDVTSPAPVDPRAGRMQPQGRARP